MQTWEAFVKVGYETGIAQCLCLCHCLCALFESPRVVSQDPDSHFDRVNLYESCQQCHVETGRDRMGSANKRWV